MTTCEIDCSQLANVISEMLMRRLHLAGFEDVTINVKTEHIWAKFGVEVGDIKEWWHVDTTTIGVMQSDLLFFVDRLALDMVGYFRQQHEDLYPTRPA